MKRQAFMFAVLGVACGALGIRSVRWGWLVIWLGTDFLIVAAAYFTRFHRVFGKHPNGTLPLWSWCLYFPYLAYTVLVWNLARILSREPAFNAISVNLVVGRRLLNGELPSDIANYIDLTAEFQESRQARQSAGYLSFPILDAGVPKPETLREMVTLLKPGKTFVHCAQGHGRTGLFALAVLLAMRTASTVDEGLQLLRSARPGIRLNSEQRSCIDAFAQLCSSRGDSK